MLCLAAIGSKLLAGPIASGYWVKLKISKQGTYRIDYSDLQAAGFNMATLDPRKLQLIGHQGGMLPEFNANRNTGLPEIPIWISGESDGKFDPGDFIIFYAGSTDKWIYSASQGWTHQVNDYTNNAFLYLGVADNTGKRISLVPETSETPQQIITQGQYVWFHDSDIVNPAGMGRMWLGEKLGNETLKRNFSHTMPAGTADSARVRVSYGASMVDGSGILYITVNGQKETESCAAIDPENLAFYESDIQKYYKTSGGAVNINLELIRPNTNSSAWLNFIEIQSPRLLEMQSEPLVIRNALLQSKINAEVRITSASNLRVFGITREGLPMEYTMKNSGGNNYYFRTDNTFYDKDFVVFSNDKCYKPGFAGTVANADILAGDPATLIIIAHPDFLEAANNLAAFRRTADQYKVKVVTPQAIYNEYSASMQDIVAIRDYLRDEYNKAKSNGGALKYVLLFGAASYDFKDRTTPNVNKVPLYEDYSYLKNGTFCLDDFYGYIDSNMGRPAIDANKLSFAVGRLPVRTKTEANGVVEKLKRYYSPKSLGPWRTGLSFVCDDVDKSFEDIFAIQSESYANNIAAVHPDMQVDKIYADAYKQVTNGNTEQYPEVTEAITNAVQNGALFLNYQGHGGEKGWAQEQILTVPTINAWTNPYTMPVLFTATCEFSRYDDPALQSAGELTLINPNGGAIALMTTTRLVYVSGNSLINENFWTKYGFPSPNEPVPTIGDLFQRMKNRPFSTTSSEDNKFALLGDPSMRLAFPMHKVVIDSINGKDGNSFTDTLKAFSVVRLKGHIHERLGNKFSSFNGKLWVKVLDKPQTRYTLDNDGLNKKVAYKTQTSYIYKGIVSVVNGEFSIIFSVPKDIAYNVDLGKILLYAHNGETDASGGKDLLIGSSENSIIPDKTGPEIKLYMNDTTFVFGGEVQPNATFIARIFDKSGINATGAGIGRDMVGVLDKGSDHEKSYIMNEFFAYDLNSYTRGAVQFDLKDLSVGEHTITFKVWDIHNNSAEAVIKFVVVPKNALHITDQLVYPNPFQPGNPVTVLFEHNKAGEDITAELIIYNQSGKAVSSQTFQIGQANARETRVQWDGRSTGGAELPNGFYFYKLVVKSADGGMAHVQGKMIKN